MKRRLDNLIEINYIGESNRAAIEQAYADKLVELKKTETQRILKHIEDQDFFPVLRDMMYALRDAWDVVDQEQKDQIINAAVEKILKILSETQDKDVFRDISHTFTDAEWIEENKVPSDIVSRITEAVSKRKIDFPETEEA